MTSIPPSFRPKRGRLAMRARPRVVPHWWRMVDDGSPPRTWAQQSHWALVLSSCGIPFMQSKRGQRAFFYVPPLLENMAKLEIAAFSREGSQRLAPACAPVYTSGHWAVLLPFFLLLWHGLRMGWWPCPEFLGLSPEMWSAQGALDTVRVKVYAEWYRAVTALTLHADSSHVLGNVAFGSIFGILLCRSQGLGLGLLLILLGGGLGNVVNVLVRPHPLVSMGFSTALFATVGCLSGSLMLQGDRRKALVPLAAGAALLAMLGTEGERTDYVAHVAGLTCGVALGMAIQCLKKSGCLALDRPTWQWLAGTVAAALIFVSWRLAGL